MPDFCDSSKEAVGLLTGEAYSAGNDQRDFDLRAVSFQPKRGGLPPDWKPCETYVTCKKICLEVPTGKAHKVYRATVRKPYLKLM